MRSLLFLSSLLGLCWARTLLIQTEDKANSDITAMGYEDNIDDHAPEEPGNGKNTEIRKGTNRFQPGIKGGVMSININEIGISEHGPHLRNNFANHVGDD